MNELGLALHRMGVLSYAGVPQDECLHVGIRATNDARLKHMLEEMRDSTRPLSVLERLREFAPRRLVALSRADKKLMKQWMQAADLVLLGRLHPGTGRPRDLFLSFWALQTMTERNVPPGEAFAAVAEDCDVPDVRMTLLQAEPAAASEGMEAAFKIIRERLPEEYRQYTDIKSLNTRLHSDIGCKRQWTPEERYGDPGRERTRQRLAALKAFGESAKEGRDIVESFGAAAATIEDPGIRESFQGITGDLTSGMGLRNVAELHEPMLTPVLAALLRHFELFAMGANGEEILKNLITLMEWELRWGPLPAYA